MAANYIIQADVIDIRRDVPKRSDGFFVDTSVWLFMTYSRLSLDSNELTENKIKQYSAYLNKASGVRSFLYRCGLSLSELAHRIEENERNVFEGSSKHVGLTPKDYRHNYPEERKQVISEIQSAWAQVKGMADPMDIAVDDPATDEALARIASTKLDGYDLFMVGKMLSDRIVQVITDDSDYTSVPGLRVFTANPRVIEAATAQHKLVSR